MRVDACPAKFRYWRCMIAFVLPKLLACAWASPPVLFPALRRDFRPWSWMRTMARFCFQPIRTSSRYPASLTKVMTLYILFEELNAGRLKLNSRLKCSAHGATRPPSKLGLRAGETLAVEDAIKALVTRSANDVAATIAENISGSEKLCFPRRIPPSCSG